MRNGELGMDIDVQFIEGAIEAILFVSGEPVKISRIAGVLGKDESSIEEAAAEMSGKFSYERRGVRLVKLEDSLQLCSSPEFADCIRRALETRKAPQLSQPALEVLSIIAYFQPVTRAYIEQVRGVDSSYTVGSLLDKSLIESCGRLAAPGRPMLYRTTHVFLRTFGLETLRDLPELPYIEPDGDDREGIQNAIAELKEKENEKEKLKEKEELKEKEKEKEKEELKEKEKEKENGVIEEKGERKEER